MLDNVLRNDQIDHTAIV